MNSILQAKHAHISRSACMRMQGSLQELQIMALSYSGPDTPPFAAHRLMIVFTAFDPSPLV